MNMQSKVVLITGATNGIGLSAAHSLARLGARVFGVCRSAERCERASQQIRQATGNDRVEFLCADLSSLAEVRSLAEEFRQRSPRLDVLINNAGAIFIRRQTTVDGLEKTFALNHLSHFLLTNLLLDLLRASGTPQDPARVITVASNAERRGSLDEAVLLGKEPYRGFRAYGSSKLCNITFTYELARRLDGAPVVANALHPGLVATNFALDNFTGLLRPFAGLYRLVAGRWARSPERGADTLVWLASAAETGRVSGQYFFDRQPIRSRPESYDPAAARRLWELSEQLVGEEPVSAST